MIVGIRGTGIAATCCAHLLAGEGMDVRAEPVARPPLPVIMLSDQALTLMRGVFGRPALFADSPRIERRIVAWGTADPVTLPHGAVVVSETQMEAALARQRPVLSETPADFAIHAAAPFLSGEPRSFGARQAVAAQVALRHDKDCSACWIESVETGWLFLIPAPREGAWLLGIGAPMAELLAQSRHVAPRVDLLGPTSSAFETCPRMLPALCGEGWLACGTGAIAFDPICGDGTAQALREAILASAVIVALTQGDDAAALRTHYDSMLIAAMRRHLLLCAQFYGSGGRSGWWRDQLDALAEGHDWCTARLAMLPEPRYVLRDFRLVAREKAA